MTADQVWLGARDEIVPGAALAVLFREHHAELVRLALLLVHDRPTAEDVVQDVFARLHSRNRGAGKPGHELAYIRASVLNGCRSVLRRRLIANRAGLAREVLDDELPNHSAETEAIKAEERRRVIAALAALPARRREVLVLRYYLGLSEAEIAATLGISPGSVKSAASRGIAALARELGDES